MVSKTELQENSNDKLKFIGSASLLILGLVLFYAFSEQSLLYRVLGLLVLVGAAVFVAYQTQKGHKTALFFKDARTEVRKVVWPSRAETTQTTIIVMVIVFIMGIFLWLLDWMLSGAFKYITGIGG